MRKLMPLLLCALFALPTMGQTTLNGAGATFPNPMYSKWFSDYHKAHPEVEINYQSIGSGGGSCATARASTHQLNVMFGPRISISVGRWKPFGQALFGVAHISSNGFGSDHSFAMALGGGLDYRILKPVAWRFQLDYMWTQLTLPGFAPGSAQNNFRFSTSIVLRF